MAAPKPKVKFQDRDKGWGKVEKAIRAGRKKPNVQVGIFGKEAAADHGGVPNIQVAVAHEFGANINHPGGTAYVMRNGRPVFISNEAARGKNLPRTKPHKIVVPERSFIRTTVDLRKRKIAALARNLAGDVLVGERIMRDALQMLGVFVQGLIRKRMSRGIPPPLRPATVKRKGSSKPLIDTGQLRGSVDLRVNKA
jgi:hypothetical protein